MERVILHNPLSPGDVCVMTAAIKALHQAHPERFQIDYRGSASELFHYNPYLTPLDQHEDGVRYIRTNYSRAISQSNQAPRHFIEGYSRFLSEELNLPPFPVNDFRPDIYLSDQEKGWIGAIQERTGRDLPFWIIVAGGKYDYTIKWWDHLRFQQVVDHFRGKICFVRVGAKTDFHPPLRGVVDLWGETDTRQLVRLVYHSQGVLCPVTFLMHLAAGVPCRHDRPPRRPCVVVAGGREPPQWEAYPGHQFIHTIGQLSCCMEGGCWKARTVPFDFDKGDKKNQSLCLQKVERPGLPPLPKCMDMITAKEVCRRIEGYFSGGAFPYLTDEEFKATVPHLTK